MRYVVVGTVGVGKTTVRKILERKGFRTIPEPNWDDLSNIRFRTLETDLVLQRRIRERFMNRAWTKGLLHERSIRDVHIFTEALKMKYPNQIQSIDKFINEEKSMYEFCDEEDITYFYLRTSKNIDYDTYWTDVSKDLRHLHDECYYGKANVEMFEVDEMTLEDIGHRIARFMTTEGVGYSETPGLCDDPSV